MTTACSGGDGDAATTTTLDAQTRATPLADPPTDPIDGPGLETEARFEIDTSGEQVEIVATPVDLLEAVQHGVDRGLWTEPQGIAAALDGMTGRQPPTPSLTPDDVVTPGLTSLTARANELIEDPDTSEAHRELLSAAMTFFTPSQVILDAISVPSPRAISGLRGQGPEIIALDCDDLETIGFDERAGGEECLYFDERSVDGHRLRVYYPRSWYQDEDREVLIGATFDAMEASNRVYAQLAPEQLTVGNINAVFSLTDAGWNQDAAATVWVPREGEDACPLVVFPTGSASRPIDEYQQLIAHEVFHCVQNLSLPAPTAADKWWREGSATYFSNVVYPEVNYEHGFTGVFDGESLESPLTDLAYATTVFFQYFSNRRGNGATIELLDAVAGGGGLDALAEIDGIDELWQDFIVAFMADAVLDTGGGTVGGGTLVKQPAISVTGARPYDAETSQFVATRYLVEYEEEYRFTQSHEEQPRHAAVEREKIRDHEAWTALPDEVRSECDEKEQYILVTTTTEDGGPDFRFEVGEAERADCDPCVLGAWDMRLNTFQAYMEEAIDQAGGLPPGGSFAIFGHYYFEFSGADSGRTIRLVRQPLSLISTLEGVGSFSSSAEGTDSGTYTADGETMRISITGGSAVGTAGGYQVSVFTDPAGVTVSYTCEDDILTISHEYGTLAFDRIDAIPPPESVDVETGDPDT